MKNKKGAFVHKNVNFFLLALVIILLITLVGITLYYEDNYTELSDTFSAKRQELTKITEDLSTHKSVLNETLNEVHRQEESNTYFEGLYIELKDEKANLEVRYNLTRDKLSTTETDLTRTADRLREESKKTLDLIGQVAELKTTLASKDNLLDDLFNNIDDLSDYVDDLLATNETDYSRSKIRSINEDLYEIGEIVDDIEDI